MFKTRLLAAALLAAFAAPVPGALAQAASVTHAQGQTELRGVPSKVLVADWAAFDNLDALGVPVAGVPASAMPPYLAARVGADTPRIGSLQEPDIEAIAAAEPDLVIVAARSRRSYPTLAPLVPTIDMSVDNNQLIEGVEANLVKYGEIFGRQERARELVAALDAKVAEAKAAAAGKGTGLVIVTNGGRLGIYGPESRVGWIYGALGIPTVIQEVDDRDHGGDGISFEYLLERNPDWLFVVDRDAGVGNEGSARQVLDNELIHGTTFWSRNQVVYLDPAAAYVTMHGYQGLMLLLDQVIAGYGGAR